MEEEQPHAHFEGKSAFEHLKAARVKAAKASAESHGTEASGFFAALIDSTKMMAIVISLVWLILHSTKGLLFLGAAFLLWQVFRSALLGWSRLERIHRLIEQERHEITHHREQEKEELIEMYKLKGFSGEMLDRVIETLMADDNRLLMVMLEEELGLKLKRYEHPLLGSLGALCGSLIGFAAIAVSIFWVGTLLSMSVALFIIILATSWAIAKREGNLIIKAVVWNVACIATLFAFTYFLMEIFN